MNTKTPITPRAQKGFGVLLCLLLSACASTSTSTSQQTTVTTSSVPSERYAQLKEVDPEARDALFSLLQDADQAYQKGDWLLAARHYEALTQKVPQDAYAWFRLGNVRLQQGHLDNAIRAYEASLQRDPLQAKPHYNIATVRLMQAQQALLTLQQQMHANDPGQADIDWRTQVLQSLLYRPVLETRSPMAGLIQQSDNR